MKTSLLLLSSLFLTISARGMEPVGDNYSRLSLSFDVMQPFISSHGATSVSTHNLYGMGVSYLYGFNVTGQCLPFYLEVGPECSFVRRTDEIDYWEGDMLITNDEFNTQLLTLSTPIDLAYHFHLSESVVLAPAAGITAKSTLLAKESSDGKSQDLFDQGAHRFQLGWNAACGLYFHHLYLGLHYDADFTSFLSQGSTSERYHRFSFTLGYVF